jgi:hypothetical protein
MQAVFSMHRVASKLLTVSGTTRTFVARQARAIHQHLWVQKNVRLFLGLSFCTGVGLVALKTAGKISKKNLIHQFT